MSHSFTGRVNPEFQRRRNRLWQQMGNAPPRRQIEPDSIAAVLALPTSSDPSILRTFATGLLTHAVQDVRAWVHAWQLRTTFSGQYMKTARENADHARCWLIGRDSDGITFDACCDVLAVNADIVRGQILQEIPLDAMQALVVEPPEAADWLRDRSRRMALLPNRQKRKAKVLPMPEMELEAVAA